MDISLAQANGITDNGILDPRFFKRIEEALLRITKMYEMPDGFREEAQRSFRDSQQEAKDNLRHVKVEPFDVAEAVKVAVDPHTGGRAPHMTPERTIEFQRDLHLVETLMRQIALHGTTGDLKLDDTVKVLYEKLLDLVKIREEEVRQTNDPSKAEAAGPDVNDKPWAFRIIGKDDQQNSFGDAFRKVA